MDKLLTIAIPTYNRADLLDKQLAWLAEAIKGYESECEIIISDNCSNDHTQAVIKKWQPLFSKIVFIAYRNNENIGLMPNLACTMQAATSKYLWTVSDDDPIQQRTLGYVINTLKKNPNTTLMFINCCGRDKKTDRIIVDRWFKSDSDQPRVDGKLTFQHYLQESLGGILFMTSAVYKTDLVQQALQTWPNAVKNLASQAYLTGFCALYGDIIVTQDNYLECTMNVSTVSNDIKWPLLMRYLYIPELYIKLMEIGYAQDVCQRLILENLVSKSDWKILLGGFRRWPKLAMNVLVTYFSLLFIYSYRVIFVNR